MRHAARIVAALVAAAGILIGSGSPAGAAITPCPAGYTTILYVAGRGMTTITIDGTTVKTDRSPSPTAHNMASYAHHSTIGGHNWGWSSTAGTVNASWECVGPGDASWYNQSWWLTLGVHTGWQLVSPCNGAAHTVLHAVAPDQNVGNHTKLVLRVRDNATGATLGESVDATENPSLFTGTSWIPSGQGWGNTAELVMPPDFMWWPTGSDVQALLLVDTYSGAATTISDIYRTCEP